MFKDGISVPGLTLKYLFNSKDAQFTLFDRHNADLHTLVKENIVGGPSIIFHRYHEAGKTYLREKKYGIEARQCESIIGYDANALYLWCLMQDMPTGLYVRRKVEDDFKPHQPDVRGKMASEWLEWKAKQLGQHIRHKYNDKEKQIGSRRLCVDGWCAEINTVYQFHGCYWHGHHCQEAKGIFKNEKNGKSMAELRTETERNSKYITQCGYRLEELWECEWQFMKKQSPELRAFIKQKFRRELDLKRTMTEEDILQAVKQNTLFGMVQCDIHVPDYMKAMFEEMTPIFKNTDISIDDIGEHMKKYAQENNMMSQPRRSLIGSYFGKAILLTTPLLKWYLEHGLIVTKVHQVVEYWPKACFKPFGEQVSQARREGDIDVDKAVLAETMKLLGNSGYGKTVTNKDRHRDVLYCDDKSTPAKVNEPLFRQLNPLSDDLYEIQMAKKMIKYDLPLQIGFFVYQYAKLRMLQFYYDFMMKYVDPRDFEYVEMDTDSAYIAIASDSIEKVIKPDLRHEYYANWGKWLPAEACPEHQKGFIETKLAGLQWMPEPCCIAQQKFERRTPGLFKSGMARKRYGRSLQQNLFWMGKQAKVISKRN